MARRSRIMSNGHSDRERQRLREEGRRRDDERRRAADLVADERRAREERERRQKHSCRRSGDDDTALAYLNEDLDARGRGDPPPPWISEDEFRRWLEDKIRSGEADALRCPGCAGLLPPCGTMSYPRRIRDARGETLMSTGRCVELPTGIAAAEYKGWTVSVWRLEDGRIVAPDGGST